MASTRAMSCLLKGGVFKSCKSLITKAPAANQIIVNRQFHESIDLLPHEREGLNTKWGFLNQSDIEEMADTLALSPERNTNMESFYDDVYTHTLKSEDLLPNEREGLNTKWGFLSQSDIEEMSDTLALSPEKNTKMESFYDDVYTHTLKSEDVLEKHKVRGVSAMVGMQDTENETFYHSVSMSNREAYIDTVYEETLKASDIISSLFNAKVETDVFPQPLEGDSLLDNMSIEALPKKSTRKRAAHVQ